VFYARFARERAKRVKVREEYPICVQSQNTTKHKTKFITLLQHYSITLLQHYNVIL